VDLAALGLSWNELPDEQRRQVAGQIIRQRPLLWIWDDLLPSAGPPHLAGRSDGGQQELLAFLRSARDTRARILLLSRSDEQDRLGDLPVRIPLPPMPPSESSLLVRAVAASNGLDLTSLGPSSAVLAALGGNPRAIMDLTGRAVRAGCTTGDELSDYVVRAVARQDRLGQLVCLAGCGCRSGWEGCCGGGVAGVVPSGWGGVCGGAFAEGGGCAAGRGGGGGVRVKLAGPGGCALVPGGFPAALRV
jgi:hypothetical protein